MIVMLIQCKNTTSIVKTESRYYNKKRRQIHCTHNIVREFISKGYVKVEHVCIDEILSIPLTKGLVR